MGIGPGYDRRTMLIVLLSNVPTNASSTLADIIITLGVLLGLLILGVVVSLVIRRRMLSDTRAEPTGFTLQELREMRAEGRLSETEYEAARNAMIGRVRSKAHAEQSEA